MKDLAIILTSGLFNPRNAKTAFGLLRKSEKYKILAVIDKNSAGKDAGELALGSNLGIPIFATIKNFENYYSSKLNIPPAGSLRGIYSIIGVATSGGIIPQELRLELLESISYGMHIVNGLHSYLGDDPEIVKKAKKNHSRLLDIRKPKSINEYNFWTGKITTVKAPRIALLGTDCNLGKRTSGIWLKDICCENGIHTEMIFTGQTGKIQGGKYGFILDSTPNDFVSGELESAIVKCDQIENPDLILIEGQSSLRNPSGPCGSELLCSAMAKGVILQFSPKQEYFLADYNRRILPIPPIEEELELIKLFGSKTLALTLNSSNLSQKELRFHQQKLETILGVPVFCPREDGMQSIVPVIKEYLKSMSI